MRPDSPPRLLTLILLTGASALTLNMFLPSLSKIAAEFDASYALVSVSLSGYLAVTVVMQLVIGPLSDRLGRRPVILAATALFALASVGAALAQNIYAFLVFRLLQSGMSGGYAISLAIVRDTRTPRETAGVIGTIGMAMAVAPMLGPVLGGLIDAAFGWRANFWLYAMIGTLLFCIAYLDVGETVAPRSGRIPRMKELATVRRFWVYAMSTALSRSAFYAFITGAPVIAAATFGVGTATLGVYIGSITAGFFVGSWVARKMSPGRALWRMMMAGRLIATLGPLAGLTALVTAEPVALIYFGSTILVGFGNGISIPSSDAGAVSVRPDMAGAAAGLVGASTVAAGAVVTQLTGALMTTTAAAVLLLLVLTILGCLGLALSIVAKGLETEAPPRERPLG